jgi:hypothetical protein
MTMRNILSRIAVLGLLTLTGTTLCAADPAAPDDPPPPPNRPDPAALRERARNLSPEERQKMIRDFREKRGLIRTNRNEWERRREELKSLPPEEREAKLKALRQEIQQARGNFQLLSPEERETKRKEIKERVDAQTAELRKKKADGSITEIEQRRLERLQLMSKRLEKAPAKGLQGGGPLSSDEFPPPKSEKPTDSTQNEKSKSAK